MAPKPLRKADLLRLQKLRVQTRNGDAKRIRETARLSQLELGSVVGVPPSTISVWENGKRVPRGASAMRYAELLDRIGEAQGVTT